MLICSKQTHEGVLAHTHTQGRHTLNGAIMFIPGGPCELNTPLPLVRQLQVRRRVGSLWRKSSTHRNINTHTDIYRISKGSCNKKKKQNKKKESRRSWFGCFCFLRYEIYTKNSNVCLACHTFEPPPRTFLTFLFDGAILIDVQILSHAYETGDARLI